MNDFLSVYNEQLSLIKERARRAEEEAEAVRSKSMRAVNQLHYGGRSTLSSPCFHAMMRLNYDSEVEATHKKFQTATQTVYQIFQDATSRLSSVYRLFELASANSHGSDASENLLEQLRAIFESPLAPSKIQFVFLSAYSDVIPYAQRRRYYD